MAGELEAIRRGEKEPIAKLLVVWPLSYRLFREELGSGTFHASDLVKPVDAICINYGMDTAGLLAYLAIVEDFSGMAKLDVAGSMVVMIARLLDRLRDETSTGHAIDEIATRTMRVVAYLREPLRHDPESAVISLEAITRETAMAVGRVNPEELVRSPEHYARLALRLRE